MGCHKCRKAHGYEHRGIELDACQRGSVHVGQSGEVQSRSPVHRRDGTVNLTALGVGLASG